jgi:ribosomal protein S18 acetylase RimI-like enzyme
MFWQLLIAWLSAPFRRRKGQSAPDNQDSTNHSTIRPSNAPLLSIAVLPEHRGHGAANMLIEQFVNNCCKNGVGRVTLTVKVNNGRARAFYEKCGWLMTRQDDSVAHYEHSCAQG